MYDKYTNKVINHPHKLRIEWNNSLQVKKKRYSVNISLHIHIDECT